MTVVKSLIQLVWENVIGTWSDLQRICFMCKVRYAKCIFTKKEGVIEHSCMRSRGQSWVHLSHVHNMYLSVMAHKKMFLFGLYLKESNNVSLIILHSFRSHVRMSATLTQHSLPMLSSRRRPTNCSSWISNRTSLQASLTSTQSLLSVFNPTSPPPGHCLYYKSLQYLSHGPSTLSHSLSHFVSCKCWLYTISVGDFCIMIE